MKTQTLTLKYRFPALNEYTNTARTNKYAANKDKQTFTDLVAIECKAQHIKPVKSASFVFKWVETSRRRDKDNIAFAKKYILDGLVRAGVLKNDGWNEIISFQDEFEVGTENCVIVKINEV